MARDPQVQRVISIVERHCDARLGPVPAEVAQKIRGKGMSPEVKGMVAKV
jgi:hypothetical protein